MRRRPRNEMNSSGGHGSSSNNNSRGHSSRKIHDDRDDNVSASGMASSTSQASSSSNDFPVGSPQKKWQKTYHHPTITTSTSTTTTTTSFSPHRQQKQQKQHTHQQLQQSVYIPPSSSSSSSRMDMSSPEVEDSASSSSSSSSNTAIRLLSGNVICVSLVPKKPQSQYTKYEISIHCDDHQSLSTRSATANSADTINASSTPSLPSSSSSSSTIVMEDDIIHDWLTKNLATLIHVPLSTAAGVNISANDLQYISCRFICKNKNILALNHLHKFVWEKAKEKPSDLKLVIDVPVMMPVVVDSRRSQQQQAGHTTYRIEYQVDFQNFYNRRGNDHFREKKYAEAIQDYVMSMKHYPNNLKALCNRALCYYRQQEYLKSIDDLNQWFIKMKDLDRAGKLVSGDRSLIPKSYQRRARSYYALADLLNKKIQNRLPETHDVQLINLITDREYITKLAQNHQIDSGEDNKSNLIIYDQEMNQTLSDLQVLRLTLLQLLISDYSRVVQPDFEDLFKGERKGIETSAEYDIAIWNIMHFAPKALTVCPLTRVLAKQSDKFIETSVIPSEWNTNNNEENSKKLKFLLQNSDRFARVARYEDKFKSEILESFFYNEHVGGDDTNRRDSVAVDQSQASWCSLVLTWITWKRLLALPNLDVLIEGNSDTYFNFMMRCRRYLINVLQSNSTTDILPDKLYPIRFSICPLSANLLPTADRQVIFDEVFVEKSADIKKKAMNLQLMRMKFGSNLVICAGKYEVIEFYSLKRGIISHSKDTMVERYGQNANLPPIIQSIL